MCILYTKSILYIYQKLYKNHNKIGQLIPNKNPRQKPPKNPQKSAGTR